MSIRRAHGSAAAHGTIVVVETMPPDELPAGVPAAPARPVARRQDGTFTTAGARVAGRQGALAGHDRRKYAARLADQLGLAEVGTELAPYVDAASEFAAAQIQHLAATIGGGHVGPGPASIIQSAALALAASRYLYATGSSNGDPKLLGQAATIAEKSRTSLLTAHELCAREAQARPQTDPITAWTEAFDRRHGHTSEGDT